MLHYLDPKMVPGDLPSAGMLGATLTTPCLFPLILPTEGERSPRHRKHLVWWSEGVMLCSPAGQHQTTHTHTVDEHRKPTEHPLYDSTGCSVCSGELIVFRWDNLRRSAPEGRTRSKELREKRRETRAHKLTAAPDIWFPHRLRWEKGTLPFLECVFYVLLLGPHTHFVHLPKNILCCI